MDQHDPAEAHFRKPSRNGVERMAPIDVKEIDAAVGEPRDGLVERRADQRGEAGKTPIVVVTPAIEDIFRVRARMHIAHPRVDRIAGGRQVQRSDGLCKRRIAVAGMRSQLDEAIRPERIDHPECERDVFEPRGRMNEPIRLLKDDGPEKVGRGTAPFAERSGSEGGVRFEQPGFQSGSVGATPDGRSTPT